MICQSVSDVVALGARIESSPHIYRVKNYIKDPAATGYRGIHHIMRFDQPSAADRALAVRYEVQVRTCLQHRWAVWSEAHGEKAKIGQADAVHHERLRSIALDVARWERDHPHALKRNSCLTWASAPSPSAGGPPAGPSRRRCSTTSARPCRG